MKKYIKKNRYDYLGIASSGICLVHCLATPIIMAVQGYYKVNLSLTHGKGIPYWDYLFLSTCFLAVYFTTKEAISQKIIIAFWSFFILFAIAILFEEDFKYLDILGYISSIGLIITHLLNILNCRKCQTKNSQLQS